MQACAEHDDDVLSIDELSEERLVASLAERLERRRFYTAAGTILVAINPYEWKPELYSEQLRSRYRAGDADLPPHLYATAQMVDKALRSSPNGARQMVIISGESGAGKTESTKILLSFLVDAASGPQKNAALEGVGSGGGGVVTLRERVLRVNPLLEAFGNARTTRNDNSSRFGKLVELYFRCGAGCVGNAVDTSDVAGARIVNYLLEKTRLSKPPPGERNFHVLYQLLAPHGPPHGPPHVEQTTSGSSCSQADAGERPDALLSALPVGKPELLEFLRQEQPWTSDEAAAESEALASTAACLEALGVPKSTRGELWTLLAAVLLLGNLTFISSGSEGGCALGGDTTTHSVLAGLLGVTPAALADALCKRKLAVTNQNLIIRQQSESNARDARDALARAVYNGIFEHLVQQANATIQPEEMARGTTGRVAKSDGDGDAGGGDASSVPSLSSVGVLDIYGFEALESNSFEQLLINFANEKLQRLFNVHIFELEQAEYAHEGIQWTEVRTSRLCMIQLPQSPCVLPAPCLTQPAPCLPQPAPCLPRVP